MAYSVTREEDSKRAVVYKHLTHQPKLQCVACLCGPTRTTTTLRDPALIQYYKDILRDVSLPESVASPRLCSECEALLKRAFHFTKQVKESYLTLQQGLISPEDLLDRKSAGLAGVSHGPPIQSCTVRVGDMPTEELVPSDITVKDEYLDEEPVEAEIKEEPHEYDNNDPLTSDIVEVVRDGDVENMSCSDSENANDMNTPPDIVNTDTVVTSNLLPEKSRAVYEKAYKDFLDWRVKKRTTSMSENVLLAYFEDLSKKFSSASLWTIYSMVKSTLNIKHQVDISKYFKLNTLLKRKSEGYKAKKSKTFSSEEIIKFLNEAPDQLYLQSKVALIFGVMGACRRQELYNIHFSDVQIFDKTILVTVRNTKTKSDRTFTVTGSYCDLCKKYMELRPKNCSTSNFFIKYSAGTCTNQQIGINKFGTLGKIIANHLNLPNPEMYTGHCFRRTSDLLDRKSAGVSRGPPIQSCTISAVDVPTEELVPSDTTVKEEYLHEVPVEAEIKEETQEYDNNDPLTSDIAEVVRDGDVENRSCSDSENDINTAPDIVNAARIATATTNNLLPEKSRAKYEKAYNDFLDWRMKKSMTSMSEKVLLAYFEDLPKKFSCATLWTIYSMVKNMLNIKHQVDISKYYKLTTFLKRKSEGYKAKKAKTFSPEEIKKFLNEAPDQLYLQSKVALIFGVMGACRRQELYKLQFSDVKIFDKTILVTVRSTKTNRTFTVTGSYCDLCKKYMELRPENCSTSNFFLNYLAGKCSDLQVGINKFGALGKTIASYLNLPNPEMYTGHCFRRTSATLPVPTATRTRSLHSSDLQTPKSSISQKVSNQKCNRQLPMKTHTGEKPYKCDSCEKSYYDGYQLKVHKKIHTGEKPHKCPVCQKAFIMKNNLKGHMRTHTGEKLYKCLVCQKMYSTNEVLKQHMRMHTGKKLYKCSVCQKDISSSSGLTIHMRTHTGDKPFLCSMCPKRFISSMNLNVHTRTHTGEKPYKCSVCQKDIASSYGLKIHMRTHTGEKPFVCSMCPMRFSNKFYIKKHTRTHTGDTGGKRQKCSVCQKDISSSSSMSMHMRTHTGEKPFSCSLCLKSFTTSKNVKVHMITHTGEKPHKCSVCQKNFTQRSSLTVHMKSHFGENPV